MRTRKRVLALLLSLLLLFSLLPAYAAAEEESGEGFADADPVEESPPVEEDGGDPKLVTRELDKELITGFAALKEEELRFDNKPLLAKVLEALPEELTVFVGGTAVYTEDEQGQEQFVELRLRGAAQRELQFL